MASCFAADWLNGLITARDFLFATVLKLHIFANRASPRFRHVVLRYGFSLRGEVPATHRSDGQGLANAECIQ